MTIKAKTKHYKRALKHKRAKEREFTETAHKAERHTTSRRRIKKYTESPGDNGRYAREVCHLTRFFSLKIQIMSNLMEKGAQFLLIASSLLFRLRL